MHELQEALLRFGLEELKVTAEPDGEGDATYPEPRKLFIEYQSLFRESIDYIRPRVMLEVGARSLIEPTTEVRINSLVEQVFPDVQTAVVNPLIATAVIEKTFLEKAFLLHELFTTGAGAHAGRKSRHLYDLEKMMDECFAVAAIGNDELWETISHHRQVFTSMRDGVLVLEGSGTTVGGVNVGIFDVVEFAHVDVHRPRTRLGHQSASTHGSRCLLGSTD